MRVSFINILEFLFHVNEGALKGEVENLCYNISNEIALYDASTSEGCMTNKESHHVYR